MSATDLAAMDAFLAEPRNAVVVGLHRDGRPQATPNWFLWDGGKFYISTTKGRLKYRIFRNDPRVQLVIDDSTGFRYVAVDGTVDIGEDVDAGLTYFQRLRAKHGRDTQTLDELRAEMVRDGRVLLIVTPTKPQAEWLSQGF
ncbi:MAG: PPOX class F420-dependent oxidoreductase [Acidimicrobiia bacterium]|nr:PPOX class F420-dependent oxidoreductase [Acidimicrobiia bacterium]